MSREILIRLGLYRSTLLFTVVAAVAAAALCSLLSWLLGGEPLGRDVFSALALSVFMGLVFGYATLWLIFRIYDAEAQVNLLSRQDNLTGAKNRRYFVQALEHEWQRFRRYGDQFAVVVFDIDRFKQINETYGPQTGDQVLRQAAAVCIRQARAVDTFARYGADEFVFLAPNSDVVDIDGFMERIRKELSAVRTPVKGEALGFTVSMGACQSHPEMAHYDVVLSRAEQALQQAKQLGGNRCRFDRRDEAADRPDQTALEG